VSAPGCTAALKESGAATDADDDGTAASRGTGTDKDYSAEAAPTMTMAIAARYDGNYFGAVRVVEI